MRLAKLLMAATIAAVAVIAGLFAAAVVAVAGLIALIASRFVRRPRQMSAPPRPPMRTPARRMNADGAIDVTATEVPSDHSVR